MWYIIICRSLIFVKKDSLTLSVLPPTVQVILSFLVLIAGGTLMLLLPWASSGPISLVDALFTATSAVCVTGLIVLDTATDFTRFGQSIILLLIQLGGLGLMTFSIGLISLISKRVSVRWQFTFMDMYGESRKLPVRKIIKWVLIYTAVFELLITALLLPVFIADHPLPEALYISLFHSVSSFCNAGFSTFSDSLISYAGNTYLNLVIAVSFITGGIGFLVIMELIALAGKKGPRRRLSLHSKVVLFMTAILLVSGTLLILGAEWDHSLAGFSYGKRFLISFFQSATCRTAGFNTIDLALFKDNTLFIMTGLMIVGGSPGSIAGGIKTTTLWVIVAIVIGKFRNRQQLAFWKRAIPHETVERSVTLFILALFTVSVSTLFLTSFHNFKGEIPFLRILFETASAYGTVGLSTGITSDLSISGRLFVSLMMLIGRLGPLTFLGAATYHLKQYPIIYPDEELMIG